MSVNSTVDNTRSWPTPTSGSARNRSICASTGAVSPRKGSVSEPGRSTNRADGIWLAAARLTSMSTRAVVAAMHHQRRNPDTGQQRSDIHTRTPLEVPTGGFRAQQQPTSVAPPISQYWIMCNTGIGCFQTLDPEERPSRRTPLLVRQVSILRKRRPKMGHDQRADPIRIRCCEHHTADTVGHVEAGHAIRTRRVEHCQHIIAPRLQRRRARPIRDRIRRPPSPRCESKAITLAKPPNARMNEASWGSSHVKSIG